MKVEATMPVSTALCLVGPELQGGCAAPSKRGSFSRAYYCKCSDAAAYPRTVNEQRRTLAPCAVCKWRLGRCTRLALF
jgi:hypothetical protein